MKTTLTAKLKLTTTPEQFQALRTTQLAYRNALNSVSSYAFAHSKTSNQQRLQRETYTNLRSQFALPAQMACNVPRQVGATYNYHRDYSLKDHHQVSILTLAGRIIVPYQGYSQHVALLQQEATIGAARLWYDRAKKRFYLLVALEVERPNPTPAPYQQIVGVDVGQRYLAYKAPLAGSLCIKVEADYTSQSCPRCGLTSPDNRPHHGLLFVCQNCHYTLHADLVGARNIALRTLLVRQDWTRTVQLSVAPDEASHEAKAARLSRYAELRWSLASSSPPAGGE